MIFPLHVLASIDAELLKTLSHCARDNVKYGLFKHSRARRDIQYSQISNSFENLCLS